MANAATQPRMRQLVDWSAAAWAGLYNRFTSEDQLAAVLGHEIVHVVARHSAQRLAKAELTRGLTGAVMVASGDAAAAQITAVIGQLVHMKYGRDDELESDRLGVFFMADAGCDPRGMVELMRLLQESRSGAAMPEFFSTHPSPGNRIKKIKEAIGEIPRRRSGIWFSMPEHIASSWRHHGLRECGRMFPVI